MIKPGKEARWSWVMLIILSLFVLSGCSGNRYAEEVQANHKTLTKNINNLKLSLGGEELVNAIIARDYADRLAANSPQLATIAQTLKKDTTADGAAFQNLLKRSQAINLNPRSEQEYRIAATEIFKLTTLADPIIFNESLVDIVNTLADLSNGSLPRINIPKRTSTEEEPPGSYLVGNSNYGNWQQNASGSSFWVWYGQYALFRDLLSPSYGRNGSISMDSWYDRSRYSYNHDYGRGSYGSAVEQKRWGNNANKLKNRGINVTKNKKDYRSATAKKRSSTYQQMASRSYGSKSRYSSGSYSSSGKRTSTYSQFGSSSRGTSSGSRSFRGGK